MELHYGQMVNFEAPELFFLLSALACFGNAGGGTPAGGFARRDSWCAWRSPCGSDWLGYLMALLLAAASPGRGANGAEDGGGLAAAATLSGTRFSMADSSGRSECVAGIAAGLPRTERAWEPGGQHLYDGGMGAHGIWLPDGALPSAGLVTGIGRGIFGAAVTKGVGRAQRAAAAVILAMNAVYSAGCETNRSFMTSRDFTFWCRWRFWAGYFWTRSWVGRKRLPKWFLRAVVAGLSLGLITPGVRKAGGYRHAILHPGG